MKRKVKWHFAGLNYALADFQPPDKNALSQYTAKQKTIQMHGTYAKQSKQIGTLRTCHPQCIFSPLSISRSTPSMEYAFFRPEYKAR